MPSEESLRQGGSPCSTMQRRSNTGLSVHAACDRQRVSLAIRQSRAVCGLTQREKFELSFELSCLARAVLAIHGLMSHGFHDYTVSSAFERFVDGVERALTELLSSPPCSTGGSQGLTRTVVPRSVSVEHSFPFRKDAYALTLLPGRDGEASSARLVTGYGAVDFVSHASKFHDWFLPGDCIVLEPESYSRRILTSAEYHTVISGVAVALDNLLPSDALGAHQLTIPVYVPRHDARRDACGGLRKVIFGEADDGRGLATGRKCTRTQWFECDSVHGRVDEASAWVGGLVQRLEMLAARLHGVDADRMRAAIDQMVDASLSGEDVATALAQRGIMCASKRTFHLYRKSGRSNGQGDGDARVDNEGSALAVTASDGDWDGAGMCWDRGMIWAPWVSQDDPVGGVEADVLEVDGSVGCGLERVERVEGVEESTSMPFAAAVASGIPGSQHVCLFAMDAGHTSDTGDRSFLPLQVEDVSRKFLRCLDVESLEEGDMHGFPVRPEVQSGRDGFAARLHACLRWYRMLRLHEMEEGQARGVHERLCMDDVLGNAWWVARAEELGVEVESAVAREDVAVILENAASSLDTWESRGLRAMDVVALYSATIPESLRGVLQVWKACVDVGMATQGHQDEGIGDMMLALEPSRAMIHIFIGLFRAALAVLAQSSSGIVRRQVNALRDCSERLLEDLVNITRNSSDIDASLSPLYGISNVLGCIEHTAAAAASLHQRLAGLPCGEEDMKSRIVEGLITNAIGHSPNVGHALLSDELEALVVADDQGDSIGLDGPVSIEHVIEIVGDSHDGVCATNVTDATKATVAAKAPTTRHRMYVSRLPSEVRIATSILR